MSNRGPAASGAAVRERVAELLTQTGIPDPHNRMAQYAHELSGDFLTNPAQRVKRGQCILQNKTNFAPA
jgi:ABC-type microcin C transport system duplicated ATPase subunit YejF